MPVYKLQPLKQVLDIQPKVGPTIFTTPTGKQWERTNLAAKFRSVRKQINADELRWHELRGTLVTALAEAGCSEIQIAAITGHVVVKSTVSAYLNMGSIKLAEEAFTKLNVMFLQNSSVKMLSKNALQK